MTNNDYPQLHLRFNIKYAISWQILYQIIRRYRDKYDLRIYEMHPGGGQYDCLALYYKNGESIYGRHLLDLNINTTSVHYFGSVLDARNGNNVESSKFAIKYLAAEDTKEVVDEICYKIGFFDMNNIPSSNGQTVAIGLIADLAEKYIFSRSQFIALMGYEDTSGYGGGFREDLSLFDIAKPILKEQNHINAYRYFLLYICEKDCQTKNKPFALIDMKGKAYLKNNETIDLYDAYLKSGKCLTIISESLLKNAK